eukprot:3637805-Pyramimonas_sp.AAC.2
MSVRRMVLSPEHFDPSDCTCVCVRTSYIFVSIVDCMSDSHSEVGFIRGFGHRGCLIRARASPLTRSMHAYSRASRKFPPSPRDGVFLAIKVRPHLDCKIPDEYKLNEYTCTNRLQTLKLGMPA